MLWPLILTVPAFAQDGQRLAAAHTVSHVPYYGQVYTEDCETAALQMALAHENIELSQAALLSLERVSRQAPLLDSNGRVIRWGNPNTSFVGDPNAGSIGSGYTAASGYGTYAPNIARVADLVGATVLWSGKGLSRAQLENYISHNHPVIAWVGNRAGRMRWAPLSIWTAWDGSRVEYPDPSALAYEHCVLVVGWDAEGVYIHDPLDGARNGSNVNPVVGPGWVTWTSFLAGFRTFGGMAVVLK